MICIALLRAVNVGGRNLVSMPELCRLFETSGFAGARSLLASGNVVFDSNLKTSSQIETALEAATQKRFHVDVDFIVRTAGEWKAIVEGNPFPREAKEDPGHLLMMCLKNAPGGQEVKDLQAAIKGRETLRVVGRQVYISYPDGIGRSKLSGALIEKKLGTRGTGRNWNTVLKLLAMVQGRAARPAL